MDISAIRQMSVQKKLLIAVKRLEEEVVGLKIVRNEGVDTLLLAYLNKLNPIYY